MIVAPNSLVRQEVAQGGGEEEETGGRRKGRQTGTPNTRSGRSHRSNSVRGVRFKEQKKTWTVVWGSTSQEELGINPIFSR